MTSLSNPTQTVLLFARAPGSESRAKSALTRSLSASRRVYELLLRRVLRELSVLPPEIRIVISSDEVVRISVLARSMIPSRVLCFLPQVGALPEERLRDAIAGAERLGGSSLVVIGADTPGLRAQHITRALSFVSGGCVVLGPSVDGGFYLLAGRAPLAPLLSRVSFGGQSAAAVIVSVVEANKPLVLLERLIDLDTPADVERLKAALLRSGEHGLMEALRALALPPQPEQRVCSLISLIDQFLVFLLRGPPLLCFC